MKPLNSKLLPRAREEGLVVQNLGDEVLVYDLETNKAHCLNRTSAFIWTHCDGETAVDQIARLMEKEWHTPVREDLVWLGLGRLGRAGLLNARIKPARTGAGISRRTAVRRLGALLAVPAVISIVAPMAMAAVSIPAACRVCIPDHAGCPPACENIEGHCFSNPDCFDTKAANMATCAQCFRTKALNSWRAP